MGWRHSFAFYIPAISCIRPLGHPIDHSPVGVSGSVCNTRTKSHGWDNRKLPRGLTKATGNAFEGYSDALKNLSDFQKTIPVRSVSPAVTGEHGNFEGRFSGRLPERPEGPEDAPPAGRISHAKDAGGRHAD